MTTELEALRAFHRSFQGAGTKSLASLTEERLTLWHDAREAGEKAALSSAKSAPQEVNEWQRAVIDALVVNHTYIKAHDTDPRKALHDLICWEVQTALDPKVSEAARALLAATPPREVAAIEPVAWAGCGECDCVFKCYGGAARCIRLVAESPTPQDGAVEPAGYIYEWDIPLGRHQKLEDSPYNGSRPHRSYPYYTHAESPSLPVSVVRDCAQTLIQGSASPVASLALQRLLNVVALTLPESDRHLLLGVKP